MNIDLRVMYQGKSVWSGMNFFEKGEERPFQKKSYIKPVTPHRSAF